MSLSSAQRADVRRVLGWSSQFSQTDNALENAFDGIATEPDHEAQIISLLADVAAVETALKDAWNRLKATQVGSIRLDALKEMAMLRSEGMRFTGTIASLMGVERRHNIFGTSSPSRQGWRGPTGYGGERNYF